MKAMKPIAISMAVSILIGGIVLFAVLNEFAGKGRYDKSAFLFPYAFLTFHLWPTHGVLLPLMFAQFPAYGFFYGWAWSKHREGRSAVWLVSTQFILGFVSFVLYRVDFLVSRGRSPF